MKLSRQQTRAIKLAGQNNGIVDTFRIAGTTGKSLWKLGLVHRHYEPGEYEGSNVSYELTSKGWQVYESL